MYNAIAPSNNLFQLGFPIVFSKMPTLKNIPEVNQINARTTT
jgi:hypothetical protein